MHSNIFKNSIIKLFSSTLFLPFISVILFIFVFIPLHALRLLVTFILSCSKSYRLIDTHSSAYVAGMYSNPVVGTVLCQVKLEGQVSVRDVKAFFEQKVKTFPELTCFISTFLGFWCLKRDLDFAIENHVFENHPVLDDYTKLEKLKSELLNSPYPAGKSPWSVYITRNGTNSILLFRIHHVLGDGYSLMQILSGDKDIKRPYVPQKFCQRPVLFIKSVFTILPTFKGIPVTNDNFTSTKSFLVEATNGIPLSWLKEIRAKEGTKFLAIPITAATMALQDLYNNKGLEKQEFFGFYAPVPPPEPIGKGMRNGL